MEIITLSKKGQIVIPSQIRRKYDLKQGDRFLVVEDGNGKITLQLMERHPLLALRGAFKEKPSLTDILLRERKLEQSAEDKKA